MVVKGRQQKMENNRKQGSLKELDDLQAWSNTLREFAKKAYEEWKKANPEIVEEAELEQSDSTVSQGQEQTTTPQKPKIKVQDIPAKSKRSDSTVPQDPKPTTT